MSIYVDEGHTGRRSGHHRARRLLPYPPDDGVRHPNRRGRHPRQGRSRFRGTGRSARAGLRHRRRRPSPRQGPTHRWSTCLRRSLPGRSWRRPTRASRSSCCVTEGIPVLDMTRAHALARDRGARVLGPNCPGIICPGKTTLGIIPGRMVVPGPVGLISRSGDAHLRGRAPSHPRRAGTDHMRGNRRATRSSAPASWTASPPSRRIPKPRRS